MVLGGEEQENRENKGQEQRLNKDDAEYESQANDNYVYFFLGGFNLSKDGVRDIIRYSSFLLPLVSAPRTVFPFKSFCYSSSFRSSSSFCFSYCFYSSSSFSSLHKENHTNMKGTDV